MGRINPNQMDDYVQNVESEWLRLADDGDVERVQFMYSRYEELDAFTVHRVPTGETYSNGGAKERLVDCKRSYDGSLDECPLCSAGYKVEPALFLSMWSHNDHKIKIWQRGRTFRKIIESKFNRYPDLSQVVFEIERHGKKGDNRTTYELIAMPEVEPENIDDIEKADFLGTVILDWSPDDMQRFLDTGKFASDDKKEVEVRRRPSQESTSRRAEQPRSRRRV